MLTQAFNFNIRLFFPNFPCMFFMLFSDLMDLIWLTATSVQWLIYHALELFPIGVKSSQKLFFCLYFLIHITDLSITTNHTNAHKVDSSLNRSLLSLLNRRLTTSPQTTFTHYPRHRWETHILQFLMCHKSKHYPFLSNQAIFIHFTFNSTLFLLLTIPTSVIFG